MNFQPMNIITTTLILGLQLLVIGVDDKKPIMKLIGGGIMLAGWIMNIIAIFQGGLK